MIGGLKDPDVIVTVQLMKIEQRELTKSMISEHEQQAWKMVQRTRRRTKQEHLSMLAKGVKLNKSNIEVRDIIGGSAGTSIDTLQEQTQNLIVSDCQKYG